MPAPTDVKEIREAGVTNEVTAATRSTDVKVLLATAPGTKDETISPEELFSGFTSKETTIFGNASTFDDPRAAGTRSFGITEHGRVLRENSHYTVAGTTVTMVDLSEVDGTQVTWFYKEANPVSNPAQVRAPANIAHDDTTTIDLDAVNIAFITPPAAGQNYIGSGSQADITIHNESNTEPFQWHGLNVLAQETVRFANPGSGWRVV